MAITRLTSIPTTIYKDADLIFNLTISVNGEEQATLTGGSAKFGLRKKPLNDDSTNALSVNGVYENSTTDFFKFDVSDTSMDLDAGIYTYSVEYTDADNIKYITHYGELKVKDSVF